MTDKKKTNEPVAKLTEAAIAKVKDMMKKEGKEDSSYLRLIFSNPMLLTALLLSILGAV